MRFSAVSHPALYGPLAGCALLVAALGGGPDQIPGPDGARAADSAAPQSADPVLDSVRARMPGELAGSDRTRLEIGTAAGVTAVRAVYEGPGGPVPRIEAAVARGMAAQRSAHERFVSGLRQEGRVSRTDVDGIPVFRGTTEGHAFVVGFPGRFVLAVTARVADGADGEAAVASLEGAFRHLLSAAISPLLDGRGPDRGAAERSAGGFVHSTVVWDSLSFSLSRPTAWSVSDLGAGPRLPRALVLMRDPEAPGDGFRAALQPSGAEPISLGSDGNVAVVLSGATPGDGASTPAGLLEGVRRSGLVAEMLAEGRATGPVGRRAVGRDTLASFSFRGRDREGREVHGWFYAVPVGGRTLRGQILVGPTAPATALDTAERSVASVASGGGDDGR